MHSLPLFGSRPGHAQVKFWASVSLVRTWSWEVRRLLAKYNIKVPFIALGKLHELQAAKPDYSPYAGPFKEAHPASAGRERLLP